LGIAFEEAERDIVVLEALGEGKASPPPPIRMISLFYMLETNIFIQASLSSRRNLQST
jgi:hypothetical protein